MLKQSMNLIPSRPDLYQAKMVFYLFIASLSMFFIASLITYLTVRDQAFNPIPNAVPGSIATMGPEVYQPLKLPVTFWVSTVLLIATSYTLHRACRLVRREKQQRFRRWLIYALGSAIAFTVLQSFGLWSLLTAHFSQTDGSTKVYGMSFALSFIHALHVVGGIIFLLFIIRQAFHNRYDHERHWAVDNCAGYWHFLDAVWACMLVVFVVTR